MSRTGKTHVTRRVSTIASIIFAVAALLSALGCRTFYVFTPVDVETEQVSAPYRLTIQNSRDTAIKIVPAEGASGAEEIILGPGRASEVGILIVKKLKVGGNQVAQVMDGPYLTVAGASLGKIEIVTTLEEDCPFCHPCNLEIDVTDNTWFATPKRQRSDDAPRLTICVNDCSRRRVTFRDGPSSDECSAGRSR